MPALKLFLRLTWMTINVVRKNTMYNVVLPEAGFSDFNDAAGTCSVTVSAKGFDAAPTANLKLVGDFTRSLIGCSYSGEQDRCDQAHESQLRL